MMHEVNRFIWHAGTGSLDGETSGACTGNTIIVKIIDAYVQKIYGIDNANEF